MATLLIYCTNLNSARVQPRISPRVLMARSTFSIPFPSTLKSITQDNSGFPHVDVSGEIADTIESPWGLSSSPYFDTIHKQTTPSLPSLPVLSSLSVHSSLTSLS